MPITSGGKLYNSPGCSYVFKVTVTTSLSFPKVNSLSVSLSVATKLNGKSSIRLPISRTHLHHLGGGSSPSESIPALPPEGPKVRDSGDRSHCQPSSTCARPARHRIGTLQLSMQKHQLTSCHVLNTALHSGWGHRAHNFWPSAGPHRTHLWKRPVCG